MCFVICPTSYKLVDWDLLTLVIRSGDLRRPMFDTGTKDLDVIRVTRMQVQQKEHSSTLNNPSQCAVLSEGEYELQKAKIMGTQSTNLPDITAHTEVCCRIRNPVGALHELCTDKHWMSPSFALLSEETLPYCSKYTFSAKLYSLQRIGVGNSKRLAKRDAANNLLSALLKLNILPHTIDSKSGYKNQSLIECGTFNFKSLLDQFARKSQLTVQYVKLRERTASLLRQCLVQIDSFPMVICRGCGRNSFLAANDAAMQAMDCLQIILRLNFENSGVHM